jgi:hypothetical protein
VRASQLGWPARSCAAENGAIPKGAVVSPELYLLPKGLGGLAR